MEKENSSSENGELTPQQAIERLVQAIYVGQTRGAWKLEEVPELLRAVKVFTAPPSQNNSNPSSNKA